MFATQHSSFESPVHVALSHSHGKKDLKDRPKNQCNIAHHLITSTTSQHACKRTPKFTQDTQGSSFFFFLWIPRIRIHTLTHTLHTHKHIHKHTRTQKHIPTHTHILIHHTHIHTYTHTHIHTYTHTHRDNSGNRVNTK